jgi:uncharacterized protein YndB with AHSA1/START domain
MPKLFVQKTIEIKASTIQVWEALTKLEKTAVWAKEFSSGGPEFHIESDWQVGSPVLWKGQDGAVIVEGNVVVVELYKILHFTVFDVRSPRPSITAEDGITFKLVEHNGVTMLHLTHGDFSVLPEGEKYCRMSVETWDRVLPKIKELAEK